MSSKNTTGKSSDFTVGLMDGTTTNCDILDLKYDLSLIFFYGMLMKSTLLLLLVVVVVIVVVVLYCNV